MSRSPTSPPPTPSIQAFEMDTMSGDTTPAPPSRLVSGAASGHSSHRKEYIKGIALLLVVVLLWTSSNFLTQDLYEGGFNKPFLVTYMNTSSFSLYLLPYLMRLFWRNESHSVTNALGSYIDYQPLARDDRDQDTEVRPHSQPSSGPLVQTMQPLTDKETAKLAFAFCLVWFIANWSVNASLSYTSVASATILSSMSGFFTLAIGRIFRVENLTLLKIAAVCTSFVGVILVSLSDTNLNQAAGPTLRPPLQNTSINSRATLGDILALISAVFYAIYVILLKVRIKSESRIDMQLFFGFVGLFNIIACWPIGVVLHLSGIEVFELPHSRAALSAIFINMAITLSSDYIYVIAMLKTTPLLVTIGLSLTIPVAVLGDFLRQRPTELQVLGGASLVLLSFIAIGFEDSNDDEEVRISFEGQES